MNAFRTTLFAIAATAGLGLLAGCQSTATAEWKNADPKAMDIDMSLTFFNITKAQRIEDGSFVGEAINFKGGYFARYDYYRGYVVEPNEDVVRRSAANVFEGVDPASLHVKKTSIEIGDIRYVTYTGPETCLYFRGGAGEVLNVRGKRTRKITLEGMYCEPGQVADLEQTALEQFGKIKLR